MTHPAPICHALIAMLWSLGATPALAQPDGDRPRIESALIEGRLAAGEQAMNEALKANPTNDQARFSLGIVQFLRAVETRIQAFYRHGYRRDLGGGFLSLTGLPIPANAAPEPLDYLTARALLQGWVDDLRKAGATLAQVTAPDVKLPLRFGLIRLDFNADGRFDADETLWRVYSQFNRNPEITAEAAKDFIVALDRGDVDWLRGYCHFLMAMAEMILAHDFENVFVNTAHVLFRGVKVRYPFLDDPKANHGISPILDLAAMIHLIRLPVIEPARLKAALGHFEAMIALSRSSWKAILAETDNDHEWIPNPKQGTVMPGGSVSAEMVEAWYAGLDEFEAILAGRKLVPFWRGDDRRLGINLRRVFTEPRPFDLVLWIQGTAAAAYLQSGEVTSAETWSRLNRVFRGEFLGFAIWFN